MRRFVLSLLAASLLYCPAIGIAEEPRWEADIQTYEMHDRESPPPAGANVFIGSSSIRLWKLADSFPQHVCLNRGFGGSEMSDAARYVGRLALPLQPATIVLYSGDNDLAKQRSPADVVAAYQDLARQVRESSGTIRLVVLSLKPSPKRFALADQYREANRLLTEAVKATPNAVFVDVWTPMLGEDGQPRAELYAEDQLHLNPAGYQLWSRLVEPHLAPVVGR